MNVVGRIIAIGHEEVFSEKFKKRNFVVRTEGQYPDELPIETHNDNCGKLAAFKVGDYVDVSINLRGRAYEKNGEKKWFANIVAWKIDKNADPNPVSAPQMPQSNGTSAPQIPQSSGTPAPSKDGLPF